jgi:hypothetical protein
MKCALLLLINLSAFKALDNVRVARGQVPRPSKRGEAKPQRLSQSTLARTYATVRDFPRWIHQHVVAFPLGCPTDGVKVPEEEEPKWKGLSRLEQLRLLTAVQTLRVRKESVIGLPTALTRLLLGAARVVHAHEDPAAAG